MQVKALKDLHFPGNKTIPKDKVFDIKKIKVKVEGNEKELTDKEIETMKSKKLIEEVK
jgi:hypothetical protein